MPLARSRRRLEVLLGCLAAAAVLEIVLRPFATALDNDWHSVPIAADSLGGVGAEVRQYHEGIARAHFSPAHARLTGNAPLAGAPVAVILGDSYVEARQVSDRETMGSVLERAARAAGVPLNVRQYGWMGANIAQYAAVAPAVLRRWDPPWVAVVLNQADLSAQELAEPPKPFPPRASGPGADGAAPRSVGGLTAVAKSVLNRSTLAYELLIGALDIRKATAAAAAGRRSAPPASDVAARRAALRALRAAYGERLVVLYAAEIGPSAAVRSDTAERSFLALCAAESLRCAGTADRMVAERDAHAVLARGFVNTTPGRGHPNGHGHRMMGEELWRAVRSRSGLLADRAPAAPR